MHRRAVRRDVRSGGSVSILDVALGQAVFVVGVEDNDDPPESVRVYLNRRYDGHYVVVADPGDVRHVRAAWGAGGHVSLSKRNLDGAAIYCDNASHEHAPAPVGEPTPATGDD